MPKTKEGGKKTKAAAQPIKKRSSDKPTKPSLLSRLSIRLSHSEIMLFTKYLSVLLEAGIPIDEALDIINRQAKGPLKKIITGLMNAVQNGQTLATGMRKFPQVFSPVYTNLVEAGELSGTLKENINYLTIQLQKQHDIRQKIRSALTYPVIILIGGTAVAILIIVFVLPNITALFKSLNVELPWTTRLLLWVANILETYPKEISLGAIVAVIAAFVLRRFSFVQVVTHWAILRLPIFGKLARYTTLARVTRLLGTLLKSGIPINEALPITKSVVSNRYYRSLFTELEENIVQGKELADITRNYPVLIPPMATHLIEVGSETGSLEKSLLYLAEFYEKDVDDITHNMSTLIEPILMAFIGILVGFLAFAVISPIYQVVGQVN